MATLTTTIAAMVTANSIFFAGLENTYGRDLYYELTVWVGATVGILTTGQIVGHVQKIYKQRIHYVNLVTPLDNIHTIGGHYYLAKRGKVAEEVS